MAIRCENCPLNTKALFVHLTADELRDMQRFKVGELTIDPGTPLLMEGSNSPQLFTALRGLGLRYKTLPNGRRQVLNFVFPGDFIGLQAGVMGEMKHSVEATTHMTLCVFDRSELWNLFKIKPERGFDLTWLAAVEEHFMGEAVATIGQRTALEAVAWALLRVFRRGQTLDLVRNFSMALPFRQQDLADSLGLSLVHTNKTLGKLRDRQVASWTDGTLQVNDLKALADIAQDTLENLPKRPLI